MRIIMLLCVIACTLFLVGCSENQVGDATNVLSLADTNSPCPPCYEHDPKGDYDNCDTYLCKDNEECVVDEETLEGVCTEKDCVDQNVTKTGQRGEILEFTNPNNTNESFNISIRYVGVDSVIIEINASYSINISNYPNINTISHVIESTDVTITIGKIENGTVTITVTFHCDDDSGGANTQPPSNCDDQDVIKTGQKGEFLEFTNPNDKSESFTIGILHMEPDAVFLEIDGNNYYMSNQPDKNKRSFKIGSIDVTISIGKIENRQATITVTFHCDDDSGGANTQPPSNCDDQDVIKTGQKGEFLEFTNPNDKSESFTIGILHMEPDAVFLEIDGNNYYMSNQPDKNKRSFKIGSIDVTISIGKIENRQATITVTFHCDDGKQQSKGDDCKEEIIKKSGTSAERLTFTNPKKATETFFVDILVINVAGSPNDDSETAISINGKQYALLAKEGKDSVILEVGERVVELRLVSIEDTKVNFEARFLCEDEDQGTKCTSDAECKSNEVCREGICKEKDALDKACEKRDFKEFFSRADLERIYTEAQAKTAMESYIEKSKIYDYLDRIDFEDDGNGGWKATVWICKWDY